MWSVTALVQTPGHDKGVWALQSSRTVLSETGAGGHWGHPPTPFTPGLSPAATPAPQHSLHQAAQPRILPRSASCRSC